MNIDIAIVKPPDTNTVDAYHSALLSMPGIVQRACAPKSVHREVAETSQRSMLTNTAGILAVRCIVIPNADSIPANLRFDETTASDGAIMARRIYAKAMNVAS